MQCGFKYVMPPFKFITFNLLYHSTTCTHTYHLGHAPLYTSSEQMYVFTARESNCIACNALRVVRGAWTKPRQHQVKRRHAPLSVAHLARVVPVVLHETTFSSRGLAASVPAVGDAEITLGEAGA